MAIHDILADISEATERKKAEIDRKFEVIFSELTMSTAKRKEELDTLYRKRVADKIETMNQKAQMHIGSQRKALTLQSKHKVLDAVFAEAMEELVESKDYASFLAGMLSKVEEAGTVVYAKGKKKETEDAIKKSGKKLELGKEGDFKGGAKVTCKTVEYDFSFESLLSNVRAGNESEIAGLLFN